MIRKQFYVPVHQEKLLKRLAKDFGITEAELIRQGLNQLLRGSITVIPDPKVWKKERTFIARWGKKRAVKRKKTWRREDLYR